jgi:hypothetical protein
MPYQFAQERPDYSDLASGRVFHSLSGHPPFPIRLASEVLQRCLAIRAAAGSSGPVTLYDPCCGAAAGSSERVTLYDPCCGAAYHLSVLAYLHWPALQAIVASDVDPQSVEFAGRNLALLSVEGLDRRIAELTEMYQRYGKESHAAALSSARSLRQRLVDLSALHPIQVRVFQANALDRQAVHSQLQGLQVDIVFTDVPYGQHSQWQRQFTRAQSPMWAMLDALRDVLVPTSLVAVVSDKQQKGSHEGYRRVQRFQIGKRQIVILRPGG